MSKRTLFLLIFVAHTASAGLERYSDLVVSDAEASRTLSAADVDALFEPTASYGAAPAMIHEVLSDWAKARESAL